ncbi:MAG: TIGR01777 family oxidoreductase [Planctomycetota bacterium]|nr:TIGR01777 family oxidoreductase [Planctomycetota bacterium]
MPSDRYDNPEEDGSENRACTVLMTGSSGLIGSALIPSLEENGYRVLRAVRRDPIDEREIRWRPLDPPDQIPEQELQAFEQVDAVIHLAGKNIAEGRWSPTSKMEFRSSRVDSTRNLVALFQKLTSPPKIFIGASAIGGYRSDSDEVVTEDSPFTSGFLAELCSDWEASTNPLGNLQTRVVLLRIGLVLSDDGGALKKLVPLFRWCLGSRLGTGRQWMSWIDLDDLIEIILLALRDPELEGVLNCTAPGCVRNRDFTSILAAFLRRPVAPPVPGFLIKLLLGEMGQTLLLQGARVSPKRLLERNYRFLSPDLPAALRRQLR